VRGRLKGWASTLVEVQLLVSGGESWIKLESRDLEVESRSSPGSSPVYLRRTAARAKCKSSWSTGDVEGRRGERRYQARSRSASAVAL
jgi:hypothetical protein